MSAVLACHPETGAQVVVDDGALIHLRLSGWMTQAESDAQQEAAADAAVKQEAADAKAAAKDSGDAAKKEK